MKKISLAFFFVAALLLGNTAFAQLEVGKGSKFLNAGIGLGGWGGIGYAGGIGLGASFEVGVADNITVGAIGAYRGYSGYGAYYSIGGRGSYHFNEILKISEDKLDVYAGLGLIYSGWSWNESFAGFRGSYGGVGLGGHVGARYFFKPNLGAFAEAGFGVAPLQVGLSFKF
ncbi:hypothetical protein F5984_15110 [Rudanella paleaurantiibacter]|uniref:Outer membrane beta-barrel protein n=1 Tax=Rudanella paleaurantiibacter TaxID=2614655 RepID=A0A7J5TZA9_9BACT|nr:hypothetical protein [Rudanella paleaurantiibacter]KAB7730469.1 hypothetical protein F5984_15110 [Rudanella paleaurantiibacter]